MFFGTDLTGEGVLLLAVSLRKGQISVCTRFFVSHENGDGFRLSKRTNSAPFLGSGSKKNLQNEVNFTEKKTGNRSKIGSSSISFSTA